MRSGTTRKSNLRQKIKKPATKSKQALERVAPWLDSCWLYFTQFWSFPLQLSAIDVHVVVRAQSLVTSLHCKKNTTIEGIKAMVYFTLLWV